MANAAADCNKMPMWSGRGCRILFCMDVNIGASGAATVAYADDPKFTCTKNTTGVYDITFPACINGRMRAWVQSPLLTVLKAVAVAMDITAGTAQIKTLDDAATATEPASGDKIFFEFLLDSEKV